MSNKSKGNNKIFLKQIFVFLFYFEFRPHRNLQNDYTEAWHLGKKGMDCHHAYPKAKNCLIDNYLHVREDYQRQHFVK